MMILLRSLFAPSFITISAVDAFPILKFVLWTNSTHAKTGVPLSDLHMIIMVLLFCLKTTSKENEKTLLARVAKQVQDYSSLCHD